MKYTVLILIIAIKISAFGQSDNKLKLLNDRLIHELGISQVDTIKATIMLQLAENLMYTY